MEDWEILINFVLKSKKGNMNTVKLLGRAFLCAAAGMTTLMANSKANQSEISMNDRALFPEVPDSIWDELGIAEL